MRARRARSRFPGHRLEPVDTASCPQWGRLHGRFPILCRIALASPYARCIWEHRHLAVLDLSAKDRGCPVAANPVIADLRAGDLAMIVGGTRDHKEDNAPERNNRLDNPLRSVQHTPGFVRHPGG